MGKNNCARLYGIQGTRKGIRKNFIRFLFGSDRTYHTHEQTRSLKVSRRKECKSPVYCVLGVILLSALFCVSSMAEAQQKKKRKRSKRVVIDFQDELLEGSVSNPSIFHLFHKKQMHYGRLIKLRKNFLPEMRRTAREIK